MPSPGYQSPRSPSPRRRSAAATRLEWTLPELIRSFVASLRPRKPSRHTIAAYERDLAGIGARMASELGRSLDELGAGDLDVMTLEIGFGAWADDHSHASVSRAWSSWNRFFEFLVKRRLVGGSPMAGIEKPRRPQSQPRTIRSGGDAFARLIATAATRDERARRPWPERDLALVVLLCSTGMRLSEVTGLRIESIDGEPGACRIKILGKGLKERVVPIEPAVDEIVARYLRSRSDRLGGRAPSPSSPLLVHHTGSPITNAQVQYLVKRLYERAGLRGDVPRGALVHALRHTFATTALESGIDLVEVKELLGHASVATTNAYLSATGLRLREAVKAHPVQSAVRRAVK